MFLVVVNAINFIDGIDGLAITQVIKTIILIEFFSETPTSLFPLGSLVISSLIPLYYFNFKMKRKVFLGDGGSLLLGTLVMIYILYVLGPNYHMSLDFRVNKVLFAVLVTFYPLIDLLRVFILRIKDGKSPFVADQRHLHHLIIKVFKKQYFSTFFILLIEILLIITVCSMYFK